MSKYNWLGLDLLVCLKVGANSGARVESFEKFFGNTEKT